MRQASDASLSSQKLRPSSRSGARVAAEGTEAEEVDVNEDDVAVPSAATAAAAAAAAAPTRRDAAPSVMLQRPPSTACW